MDGTPLVPMLISILYYTLFQKKDFEVRPVHGWHYSGN